MGLEPDGDAVGTVNNVTSPHARPLPGPALWRDFTFITLAAGAALSLFAQIGLITHLYSLLVPPLGAEWAGLVMGVGTGAGMGGRMLVAWLMPVGADRRLVACMSYAVQIVGTLLLIAAAGENIPLLLAGVLLFGVGIGNVTSMPPLIAQVEFVKDDVPRVVALVVAIGQATYAFAPAAFGFIREFAGAGALFAGAALDLPDGDRRAADRPLRLDEVGARVSLKIEQRGEVAVVDARMRGFGDLRLGVIGDARARPLRSSQDRWRRRPPRACPAARGRGDRAARSGSRALPRARAPAPATRPASLPSSTISVLPRCSSKPAIAATRPVNSVKPPDTRQVCAPFARMVASERAAAGCQRDALCDDLVDDRDRQPFSSATRSRSAGSNAISPRIARSVIAATCAFSPT